MPATSEFQAVVLAGHGSRLFPLVDDFGFCKALLPIANRPMIFYTLRWLESNDFCDISIVANSKSVARLASYIAGRYAKLSEKTKIEVFSESKQNGSFGALRHLVEIDAIHRSVFVCACDIFATVSLDRILDAIRVEPRALTAIFYTSTTAPTREPASSKSQPSDSRLVAGGTFSKDDPFHWRLLFMASDLSALEEGDNLSIPMPLLHRFGTVNVRLDFSDLHAYFIDHSVLVHLCMHLPKDSFLSVREDILPYLIRHQGDPNRCGSDAGVFAYAFSGTVSSDGSPQCVRGNSISAWCSLNRMVAFSSAASARSLPADWIPAAADRNLSIDGCGTSQVGVECLVGADCTIGEKSVLKRCIVGSGVNVGASARLTNCIVGDGCLIADCARLDSCVLSTKATVQRGCELKDCEVGHSAVVDAETAAKGELFS